MCNSRCNWFCNVAAFRLKNQMGSNHKSTFAAPRLADASPLLTAAMLARRCDPSGARVKISSRQLISFAEQRFEALQKFQYLRKRHGSVKAAAMVGASVPTLWRWKKKLDARGKIALRPQKPNGGRKSPFGHLRLSIPAARRIELLTVQNGNSRAAWKQFAADPICPPIIARYILQHGVPPTRFSHLGRVNRIQAECFVSADGRRLLVRLPETGARTIPLHASVASVSKNGGTRS